MREMDTESPVVWPAWCYTGDTATESETPVQPQIKHRKRRIPDKMMNGVADYSHPLPLNNNNNNTTNNNTSNNNNNNNVKNERLSPGTPDTSSRSRSVTPSSASYPGTPPAQEGALGAGLSGLPLSGRNYSDFMRSLAAKYNNANPNDYFGASRNGFPQVTAANLLDNRFKSSSSFPTLISQPPKEDSPSASPKKPDFPLINPFAPNPMFPPLIDMSTTQTLLAMVRTAKEAEIQGLLKNAASSGLTAIANAGLDRKRPLGSDTSSPLDLSSPGTPLKRVRVKTPSSGKNSDSESPRPRQPTPPQTNPLHLNHSHPITGEFDITSWSVEDVVSFVSGIDICAEYASKFREQQIDGSGLPLLTEEHLTTTINMKLGPALKLRSILARKMGSCSICLHCVHCHSATNTSSTSENPGRIAEDSTSSS